MSHPVSSPKDWWRPRVGLTWQWQLSEPPVDTSIEADVYDIEVFDNDASVVAELHAKGRKVIGYINVGSWEDWRPDRDLFPPEVLGKDYEGWPGERWLDIRRLDLLAPLMCARMDLCKARGFDAVEPDNMDIHVTDTGFPITYQDQLNYVLWLADEAHQRGLSIGIKNAADQLPDGGEESPQQVALRARRIGVDADNVVIFPDTDLQRIEGVIKAEAPEVAVIDSIQTLYFGELQSAPGSVAQVRECAARLTRAAKSSGTAIVFIGHVTKEGTLAGPRVLEHAVDCVLQFEGERERSFRTLRALKNRFGSTNEIGVFEMRAGGLAEVADPSDRFLRDAERVAGSCVLCAMEGTRPLLVEVQALVAPTEIVPPRRVATGIDRNRLAMVLAVLARHGGPSLASADVFVNFNVPLGPAVLVTTPIQWMGGVRFVAQSSA